MTQATLPRPRGIIDAGHEDHGIPHRPIEDRSFEAVETTVGVACGVVVGMAAAGPLGAVVGGAAGAVLAFAVVEAVERAQGRAALTTDADERARRRGQAGSGRRQTVRGGEAMDPSNPLGIGRGHRGIGTGGW